MLVGRRWRCFGPGGVGKTGSLAAGFGGLHIAFRHDHCPEVTVAKQSGGREKTEAVEHGSQGRAGRRGAAARAELDRLIHEAGGASAIVRRARRERFV